METFDLIVVGSGAAGATVAAACREAGWSVAVIDDQPFGGTCALRGCEPKKVLVAATAAVDAVRRLAGTGVRDRGVGIDWPALMRFKRTFTEPVPASREASLREQGIEIIHGSARFTGRSSLSVDARALEASRAIVIAAGTRPAPLPFDGADLVSTSDEFLDLDELPDSIVFIGGGFISFELGQVAARAGAKVTILHRDAHPLPAFDPDLVERLVERSRQLGIDVRLDAEVTSVTRNEDDDLFCVWIGQGGDASVEAALVVHGAGRVANIEALDCEAGGVTAGRRGIEVNGNLQSVSNPLVYAAGDCAASAGPPLTPIASYDGRIVAANLLGPDRPTVDYDVVASVVFTLPPLARVGLSEREARERGRAVRVAHVDASGWMSSRRVGEPAAACKIIIDQESDRVLGAHLFGPHADEVINVFALAVDTGVTAASLKYMRWAYPTSGSDVPYMI